MPAGLVGIDFFGILDPVLLGPPHLQNCQELATRSEEFGQLVFELPPGQHEQPETEMVGLQRYIMVKLRFPTVDLYPRSSWWAWEFPVHPTHLQTVAAFR